MHRSAVQAGLRFVIRFKGFGTTLANLKQREPQKANPLRRQRQYSRTFFPRNLKSCKAESKGKQPPQTKPTTEI